MNTDPPDTLQRAAAGTNSARHVAQRAALADLAFGSLDHAGRLHAEASAVGVGRHLAYFPAASLELDLTDPGQRQFGDYELLELIGEGGMGVVYRAHQISLDREVAIKLLAAGPWASREFVERFRREAQNAARMQHPNIVAIFEVGTAEEMHFFSMRLVRGSSLADVIRDEARPAVRRSAALLRTIAEAVDYAHRLNVLHLDLKPANVLLDENGDPHIADFGLARRLDQSLTADSSEVSGTPSYMAPEQVQLHTHKLTAATDIWGLGAILYELVTGRPPFRADSAKATLKLVIESHVRAPRELAPAVPRDLEAVILRCLARQPGDRYGSARALADDLGRFVEGRAVLARPLTLPTRIARWCQREPKLATTVLLAIAALLLGLLATTQQWQRAEGNAELAATHADLANQRLWQARLDHSSSAVRDGNPFDALPGLVANIREREAQGLDARDDRIRFATIQRSAPRLIDVLEMDGAVTGVALSPDGASAAIALETAKVRLIDLATGAQRWEASTEAVTHFWGATAPDALKALRFSADGRYLIGSKPWPANLVASPLGADEVLIDVVSGTVMLPSPAQFADFRDATYSPDGGFALVRNRTGQAVLMRTADWHMLGTPAATDTSNSPWLLTGGGGHLASITENSTLLNLHDPRTLAVLHRHVYPAMQKITAWAASPDGGTLVIGHMDGQIERIDFASGRSERVHPRPLGRVGAIAFSADGRWFGAVADSSEVLVWNTADSRPVAPVMRLDTQPVFHFDAIMLDAATRTVVASSNVQMALWRLSDEGTAPQRLSNQFPHLLPNLDRVFGYAPARRLLATGGNEGGVRLWRLPKTPVLAGGAAPIAPQELHAADNRVVAVDGSSIRVVSASDGRELMPAIAFPQSPGFASLSADGATLVAVVAAQMFVHDAHDGRLRYPPVALPNDPLRVALAPDSSSVFLVYADVHDGVSRELAQSIELASGGGRMPEPVLDRAINDLRFSADGRTLLLWNTKGLKRIDARSLQPVWSVPALADAPPQPRTEAEAASSLEPAENANLYINDASFSADGSRIFVLTARHLWQLDAATGAWLAHTHLSEAAPCGTFAMLPDQRGAIIQCPIVGTLRLDAAQVARQLPGFGRSEYRALALDPPGQMFARALEHGIALGAVEDGRWLTPPLSTSLSLDDHPTALTFNRAGTDIIGRSRRGRWLHWDVSPELRPVAELEREAVLLAPSEHSVQVPMSAADHALLRAQDPGFDPIHFDAPPAHPTPRAAGMSPLLVDLSRHYNSGIAIRQPNAVLAVDFPAFVPGLHRFLGIDFDARGMIQLAMTRTSKDNPGAQAWPRRVQDIAPGTPRFAALHVLTTGVGKLQAAQPLPYAVVEFTYADGTHARVPIMYIRDMFAHWISADEDHDENAARVAWVARNFGSPRARYMRNQMYAVRIANPYPQREVKSLALEATDHAWSSPAFFAITIEPLTASMDAGAAGRTNAHPKE